MRRLPPRGGLGRRVRGLAVLLPGCAVRCGPGRVSGWANAPAPPPQRSPAPPRASCAPAHGTRPLRHRRPYVLHAPAPTHSPAASHRRRPALFPPVRMHAKSHRQGLSLSCAPLMPWCHEAVPVRIHAPRRCRRAGRLLLRQPPRQLARCIDLGRHGLVKHSLQCARVCAHVAEQLSGQARPPLCRTTAMAFCSVPRWSVQPCPGPALSGSAWSTRGGIPLSLTGLDGPLAAGGRDGEPPWPPFAEPTGP